MNIATVAVTAALVALPVSASAGPREDLIEGMAKCAAVAENVARLACYDALNPQLKAAQAAPPLAAAPPSQSADNRSWYDPSRIFGTSPRQQVHPEQFGAENLTAPAPPPQEAGAVAPPAAPEAIDSISADVTEYAFNPYGRFVVFLNNGQVWQQVASDTDRAHFLKGGKNTVVIDRGILGSYILAINDSTMTFKVHRIK